MGKSTAMKNIPILFVLLASNAMVQAQEWKSNLKDAIKESSASGKEVLLLFSVPDNCETCADLEKNVLQTDEFLAYAKANFILVKQDFKSNAGNMEENLLIVEKYNKDGFFPLMVVLNKNAKTIGQIGSYRNETAREYILKLESIKKS
jgi:thioredoxin-related protein